VLLGHGRGYLVYRLGKGNFGDDCGCGRALYLCRVGMLDLVGREEIWIGRGLGLIGIFLRDVCSSIYIVFYRDRRPNC
jgi:hypothetical protein